ncbi:MAG: ribosome small subunit-dependent GTPase A [Chitinophagales bacterium]
MQGTVIQSTGSFYEVLSSNGEIVVCRIKGKFRLDEKKQTNPIAVGDVVEFDSENKESIITSILPRRNYIVRTAPNKKEHKHIIASNIDQCIIIASLAQPKTSYGFIDRILLTAYLYDIPSIVIFNKHDLVKSKKEEDLFQQLLFTYNENEYISFSTSVILNENVERLLGLMKDKTSLLIGHSGVGKSSLVNLIEPGLNLKVGEVSKYSEKGLHTTTFARMYPLSFGGSIIDTPGIKEFGLLDIEPEELGHYFPEIRSRMNNCKFNNCLHLNEKDCAILKALENGEIAPTRYNSYLNFYSELKANKKY